MAPLNSTSALCDYESLLQQKRQIHEKTLSMLSRHLKQHQQQVFTLESLLESKHYMDQQKGHESRIQQHQQQQQMHNDTLFSDSLAGLDASTVLPANNSVNSTTNGGIPQQENNQRRQIVGDEKIQTKYSQQFSNSFLSNSSESTPQRKHSPHHKIHILENGRSGAESPAAMDSITSPQNVSATLERMKRRQMETQHRSANSGDASTKNHNPLLLHSKFDAMLSSSLRLNNATTPQSPSSTEDIKRRIAESTSEEWLEACG